jgi:DNA sulfur modification protein DndB
MTEELKLNIFSKLITEKDISKELRIRKKAFVNKTIPNKNVAEYDELIENGWGLEKEFKTSKRLKKNKSHDVLFEDKVWALFASLGFRLLNKDRKLELSYDKSNNKLTQQIDVFAKDDETIIIVECKSTKEENKRGDFKKELEAYKSKIGGLRTTINQLFPDQKLKFKFILATENYSISEPDLGRLNNINGVHFDDEVIDYYVNMQKQIGLASRYQLLGSLFGGQEIPELDNKIPAIKGKMGGHTYYSFSIEPEKLLKVGYVLHRNKANVNMMPTYQRIIKRSRLKSVHEFIDNKKGYFPNSIIISIDSDKDLAFDRANTQVKSSISDIGILHLPKKYRSAYIIDGQHRLYGYANSEYKSKNSIPVVAFIDLAREEQVKLFMQINENQKAVSKNLRTTLNADLLWTSKNYVEQQKALRSRISIVLGESRNSSLFDKISIGEDRRTITQEAFDKSLNQSSFLGKVSKNKIESLGTFYNGDLDESFERLATFLRLSFNYIKECIPEIWNELDNILLINKGIYAFIKLQSDIVDLLISNSTLKPKDHTKKYFEESKTYLDPAINFIQEMDEDTKETLRKAYGTGGYIKYWRTLQITVSKVHEEFHPSGLAEYIKKEAREYNTRAFQFIRDIETYFKADFKEKLENKFGSKWFKSGVPPQIAKKAIEMAYDKNLKVENEEDEIEPWDCLTIISYRTIALKNWRDLFESDYTRPTETKISGGKDAKTQWMVKLESLRNENFHQYSVTEEEFYFLEELHDWLIKK